MAIEDIRLSLSFLGHPKRRRLRRQHGSEAVEALLDLWLFAAERRRDGFVEMADLDATDYTGDHAELWRALRKEGFLDEADDGRWRLHDWEEHQPWVVWADGRSDAAKRAAFARWHARGCHKKKRALGCHECQTDAVRIQGAYGLYKKPSAPSPSPSPVPSPSKSIGAPRPTTEAQELVNLVIKKGLGGQNPSDYGKQCTVAKRVLEKRPLEWWKRACDGMASIYPHSNGEPWDVMDLERKGSKAYAAGAPAKFKSAQQLLAEAEGNEHNG